MIPTSVKQNTPPEKKTPKIISFWSTRSGAGEQFLLLDCRAKARVEGVVFVTDIGMV